MRNIYHRQHRRRRVVGFVVGAKFMVHSEKKERNEIAALSSLMMVSMKIESN